ncbi:hypothetical protein CMV_023550, partial [Castanea mollissima]
NLIGLGRFQILCLSGSYLVAEDGGPRNRTGGISASLSSADGHVIGGGIAMLIASSPVQVVVCSFVYGGSKPKPKQLALAGAIGINVWHGSRQAELRNNPHTGLSSFKRLAPEFLSHNPNTGLWLASNQGEGVIVGVIDTGIWPESKSFNDDGMTKNPKRWKGKCEEAQEFNAYMCNKKLIGARSFGKGLIANKPGLYISVNSARDMVGHGTLTSSIVAGNYVKGASFFGYATGTASGVAPRAKLAMYKVTGKSSTYESDVIAAIDHAITDGVDVISLSMVFLNESVPLEEDNLAKATFTAMEEGVLVSTVAGNRFQGDQRIRNGYPWVMTVTASTIDRWFAGTIALGNGEDIVGWNIFPGKALFQNAILFYPKILRPCDKIRNVPNDIIVCRGEYAKLKSQVWSLLDSNVLAAIIIINNPSIYVVEDMNFLPLPCILISLGNARVLKVS